MKYYFLICCLIFLSLHKTVSSMRLDKDDPELDTTSTTVCQFKTDCYGVPGKPICLSKVCQRKRWLGEECFHHDHYCEDQFAKCHRQTHRCVCSSRKNADGSPLYKQVGNKCVSYSLCNKSSDCDEGQICNWNQCWVNPFSRRYLTALFMTN